MFAICGTVPDISGQNCVMSAVTVVLLALNVGRDPLAREEKSTKLFSWILPQVDGKVPLIESVDFTHIPT